MVLGAGLGSRLKPFTLKIPKPLLPVMGVPCIEFALTNLRDGGVLETVVNTHAHADQLSHYLKSSPVRGLNLKESSEKERLLGSAGGIRKAIPFFNAQPFFSMNADVIHFPDLTALAQAHFHFRQKLGVQMTLVIGEREAMLSQNGEYTEMLISKDSGLVLGLGSKKIHRPFFTGTAIFEPEAFMHLPALAPSDFVRQVLIPKIQTRQVAFILSSELWIDIGTPELWAEAHHKLAFSLQKNQLPESISLLLNQADPTCQGQFELGKNKIRLEDMVYETADIRNS